MKHLPSNPPVDSLERYRDQRFYYAAPTGACANVHPLEDMFEYIARMRALRVSILDLANSGQGLVGRVVDRLPAGPQRSGVRKATPEERDLMRGSPTAILFEWSVGGGLVTALLFSPRGASAPLTKPAVPRGL